MELPQQQRLFEAEGRKPTHDFLSLYGHSAGQQDPRPPSQGDLKTHDFLQPLERVGKITAKEETTREISSLERAPPHAPPPSVEHILPGGIGTYSISHISNYFYQRIPKPEDSTVFTVPQASSTDKNEEHSNCSSYTGSGFTLQEESASKKGKLEKENDGERSDYAREAAAIRGHWTSSERPSRSSTNTNHNSFCSISSTEPSRQKGQSFIDIIKSGKGSNQDDNSDDEEEFDPKKESSSPIHKGELRVKVDAKHTDQKANTPRSKHSATEQRRRSKINDRFQMLRELIPHVDQKRDKASFLLEVIEYIQFLQEKVQKYEGSYQGWKNEPAKLLPWGNGIRPIESYVDQSRGTSSGAGPAVLVAAKLGEENITVSPTILASTQNPVPVEYDMNSATTLKPLDRRPEIKNKAMPFPLSLQPNFFNSGASGRNGGAMAQIPPRLVSDAENKANQPKTQSLHIRSCTGEEVVAGDKLKEQELSIEGGTINISSVYSQGLLNTLTQALQSSGVDLSQASVSVQIELGKQANRRPILPESIVKDVEVPSSNQGTIRRRVSSGEGSHQAPKKLKASKS
ncbi:transcription factor BIM1 isoform X2 [Manihot esculenta]|uniref:transcription factor BIM1 isoform X2 n=1 Tax=Manihot esculenta TaxID=3983 RepID=UPI000B5D9394|nr:transcription factor BIM1 isoform X2 [Manihot esculenta]